MKKRSIITMPTSRWKHGAPCLVFLIFVLFIQGCGDSTGPEERIISGNGTQENPYQISTIQHLQSIENEEYLDKHFIQVRDIDASQSAEFQDGSGFKRIGTVEKPFTGSYNGNGYKIKDIKIHFNKFDKHNGLFGYVKNSIIENVIIDNMAELSKKTTDFKKSPESGILMEKESFSNNEDLSDIRGIGGLVGFNDNGVIRNCQFTGHVFGFVGQSAGGLVGVNTGLIENSGFEGVASSGGATAGLVVLNTGDIRNSYAKGRIEGMSAYGLVIVNDGNIFQSYVDAEISGTFRSMGMAGFNNGRIEESYSSGQASGDHKIAGLVTDNDGEIINSYSIININAEYHEWSDDLFISGGLVGENLENGMISNSFMAGDMIVTGDNHGFGDFGGVAGVNNGSISFAYWNSQATGHFQGVGQGNPEGTTGLTSAQMNGSVAESNMPEFDWSTVWRTTDGYPVLRWQAE